MTSSIELDPADEQGGLEQVSTVDRVASLTGVRAVAALLVMGTHAAYGTGSYIHGYVGLVYSRMEIGVAIFFALSGLLLFGPWLQARAGRSSKRLRNGSSIHASWSHWRRTRSSRPCACGAGN